jgi:hypothetical protein
MCLLSQFWAVYISSGSTIQAFRHHITLLPLLGCLSWVALLFSEAGGVPKRSVICLMNAAAVSYWCSLLRFQQCPVFSLCGLGSVMLSSNCSLLRDAYLEWFCGKMLVGSCVLLSSLFPGITESCTPHHWFGWLPCMVLPWHLKLGWLSFSAGWLTQLHLIRLPVGQMIVVCILPVTGHLQILVCISVDVM